MSRSIRTAACWSPRSGSEFYLAALKQAAVVIGNSSSGLIEAPAAGTPTVNLGIRQKGRPRAASVIDCAEERGAIERAIRRALDPAMRAIIATDDPPYGRPRDAAGAIVERLREADLAGILRKTFHDLAMIAGHASCRSSIIGAGGHARVLIDALQMWWERRSSAWSMQPVSAGSGGPSGLAVLGGDEAVERLRPG